MAEAVARIGRLHRPWHAAIAAGLAAARARHGVAILLDCHSMPPLGAGEADIVLGDRFGASAAPELVDWLEARLRAGGFRTARNSPYAGGHMLERHGRPREGVHAVQIELCRSLYMQPETLAPHKGFGHLSSVLARVIGELAGAHSAGVSLAAE